MREIEITRRRFIWASAVFAALQALPSTVRARAATVLGSIPGRPTGTTVAINLLGAATGKAYVEYGYAPGKYTAKSAVTTVSAKEPAVIELSKLKANSVVYYRTRFATTDNTFTAQSESSVALQRKPGTPFSFTVQGDSHPERAGNMFNAELYMRTVANIASQRPDFHILLGDDFSIDPLLDKNQATASNIDAVYARQRLYLDIVGRRSSVFLVNGNHEQAAAYLLDGTASSPAVMAGQSRLKYFALPANGRFYSVDTENIANLGSPRDYYAWTWGDAHFITLDPYWHSQQPVDNVATTVGAVATDVATDPSTSTKPSKKGGVKTADLWQIGLGDAQYTWFKRQLETTKAKYIFVFAHHVMGTGRAGVEQSYFYEWGGQDPKGKATFAQMRPTWEAPIHDLMVKHGVSVFFQGHDHIYVQQERDGVVYQSMPNPADDSFTSFNADAYKSGTKAPNSGHVKVSVTGKGATVQYFLAARPQDESADRKNLQIAHSYTVKPRS